MQENIDEIPVGGGSKPAENEEEFPQSSIAQADNNGPLEERLESKNWSVRANAYDELYQAFEGSESPKDEIFREHSSQWKKYLGDVNPGSLEKSLSALEKFIDKADPNIVIQSQNDIIKILIEKSISHSKPSIKQKGLECFNFLFEVTEAFDDTADTIKSTLNSKNIKIQTSAVVSLSSLVSNYGVKKVKLKEFLSTVEGLTSSSNPQLRNETMNFYKECYKWLGEQLRPLIQNLKKQQLEDLDKAFVEIKDQPKQLRLTRNEKKNQSKDEATGKNTNKQEEDKKSNEDEVLDLAEPVDILSTYNEDWIQQLQEMKKWNEKKEMLDQLYNKANVPKLQSGDYFSLVSAILKMTSDSNLAVAQQAVKVIGMLSKSLKKEFGPYSKEAIPVLFQKFKEKKAGFCDDVHQALENVIASTNIENVLSDIISGIGDKAPAVKKNVCYFLEKACQATYIDVLQRSSSNLISALMKSTDDQAGDVRDAALSALGILKGRLGESAMSKFLQDLNPQKAGKVEESAQKVQPSKYDKPEPVEQKPIQQKPAQVKKKAPVREEKKKEEVEEQQQQDVIEEPVNDKNKESNQIDEIPVGQSNNNNIDEIPVGGGSAKYNLDDVPIGGSNANPVEEVPAVGKSGYNLDNLEELERQFELEAQQHKKAPPARLAKKKPAQEEEKKQVNEDVEMKDDAVADSKFPPKVAQKKPPTKAQEKPKTTVPTKGPTAPKINDDDIGQGLSKEEAIEKVQQTFSSETVQKFDEAKWQEKVEGFKGLSQEIFEQQPDQALIEAIAKFIKAKMKDWKESNINLIKETIALFTTISQNCEKVNKRTTATIMPFLSDKIGDVKVMQQVQDLIIALGELVTPKFVALQIIKYAVNAKSPNTLKESCNALSKMIEEFGIATMPLKEMIDYNQIAANHQNVQVRNASMALFAIMYKHVGETIRNFLKEIKESTMKLIDEEFKKITPLKQGEYQSKRGLRGEAAQEMGGQKNVGALLDDALPREDISKQITPKLVAMFKNNDWKIRKQGAEKVEEILKGANMRIKPEGLTELMDNMKQRMSDPNKSVLKSYVQLIAKLVEALGPACKQYSKKVLPTMLQNIADKQSLVRQDIINAMDAWAEQIGPEILINIVGPMLVQENPELRTETLNWIIKNINAVKNCECKELVKPLVACLSDKNPQIRSKTEQVCCEVMVLTGYQPFSDILKDLKPAVQNTIKPILEKIKGKVGATSAPVDSMNSSLGQKQQTSQQTQQSKPDSNNSSLKNNQQKQNTGPTLKKQSTQNVGPTLKQQPNQTQRPQTSTQEGLGDSLRKKNNQTPSTAGKQRSASREAPRQKFGSTVSTFQQEPAQQERIQVLVFNKEKRAENDKKTKWQTEDIKNDQIERLKNITQQCIGSHFATKMFSTDFKKHVECIDLFKLLLEENYDHVIEILDIIFKWAFVQLTLSNNTTFAVQVFDFFYLLFDQLQQNEYMLQEFEALVLFPLLCEKVGLNNNILKDKVKNLIRMTYTIYDKHKCYNLIIQYGLNSKNLRAVSECLDEIGEFIKENGIDYSTEKEMKLMAKMADNSDKSIRENAMKAITEAYKHLDDDIWRVIGQVTPKVQGLFEQRFKKVKGLGSSSSTTNFQLKQENTPRAGKTQSNFGLKKQVSQIESLKKGAVTPRQGLQFNKNNSSTSQQQNFSNMSKSINQFNSSMQNNEESNMQKTPQKRFGLQQKYGSQDQNQALSSSFVKKPLPQSVRQEASKGFGLNRTQVQQKQNQNEIEQQQPQSQQQTKKEAPNTQIFDDDDEDLRILTNDNQFGEPEVDREQQEITQHIHQLKYGDLSKRVDSLVALNEMIGQLDDNSNNLSRSANDLINAFTHVLIDIFDRQLDDIPLRFAKYFITIVHKACSCKYIMQQVSEERIFELSEQLLTRLLIENLDKVGESKEGELILKNLNSSMLRILENANHTYILCVLFNLLRKYKDFNKLQKLPGLIIKCLLKLSKILEKLIDQLDMEKVLLAIHEYLVTINHDNKTSNDEMGIRIVKTVINELVKLKRDSIWEPYRVIQCHNREDQHIHRWIQIILKSLQSQGSSTLGTSSASIETNNENDIKLIVEELRNSEKFEQAIPKLHKFLEQNQNVNLNDHLSDCSQTFQQFIKTSLEKHKQKQYQQTKQPVLMDSKQSTNNSENVQQEEPKIGLSQANVNNSSRINEYQSKLTSIKQRFNNKPGSGTGTNKDHKNLNTSFSAMNTSLSQKWNQINQKSAMKKEGGQLSNTMGGFGSNNNNNSSGGMEGGLKGSNDGTMHQSRGDTPSEDQSNPSGATNQDLNKRLAEMKSKLQALKKK